MHDIVGLSVRRALAVLSFLVFGASLAATLRLAELTKNSQRLIRALEGESIAQRDRTGFWFDPRYADFLAEVKRLTPEMATVAIVVPRRPDLYVYQAYYQLAPRRVVEERWKAEASYIATYPSSASERPGSIAIAGGILWKR
ncbi:MAG: hypothetical protein WD451_01065 [Thermoanaerobaculia bacterium]